MRMMAVDKRFIGYNILLAMAAAGILFWISVKASEYERAIQRDFRLSESVGRAERALGDLMETLFRSESGVRRFLLTPDDKWLGNPEAARARALADVEDYRAERVAGSNGDDRDGAPAVEALLRQEVEAKFDQWSRMVELARAEGADAALRIAQDSPGDNPAAASMRRIGEAVAAAREKTEAQRRQRHRETARTLEKLRRTTWEGIAGIIALSGLAIVAIATRTVQLTRARQDLREANQQLESRVRERTRELMRSNEEIQRYTHVVGHDLRAPLVNIMGFTRELESACEVLKAYVDAGRAGAPFARMNEVYAAVDADGPEALRFIHSSLKRMDALIAGILQLSRLGRAPLRPQLIDMGELVEDCLSQIRKRLVESGGEATVVGPLPNIVSDSHAVKQIFTNLLDNAVKYFSPDRPGQILIGGETRGALAYFEIRDNGRGVAPQDRERVFDLFRRAGPRDQPGEGVGLAHVRSLARRLGGEIHVYSDGFTGSAFRFSLARNLDTIIPENGTGSP
jgi:signal transduction histidine kinase